MPTVDIDGEGISTAAMSVRLYSYSNNIDGEGACTVEMGVTLAHPLATAQVQGEGISVAEMTVALVSVWAGNTPPFVIVHSPQVRLIIR